MEENKNVEEQKKITILKIEAKENEEDVGGDKYKQKGGKWKIMEKKRTEGKGEKI